MQFLFRKSVLFAATFGLSAATTVAVSAAYAQSATAGAVGGTVTDTGGALLPNTVVTVKSAANGVTRTVKTTASGDYKIDALQPGTYTVTYTADGFQTLRRTGRQTVVIHLAPRADQIRHARAVSEIFRAARRAHQFRGRRMQPGI